MKTFCALSLIMLLASAVRAESEANCFKDSSHAIEGQISGDPATYRVEKSTAADAVTYSVTISSPGAAAVTQTIRSEAYNGLCMPLHTQIRELGSRKPSPGCPEGAIEVHVVVQRSAPNDIVFCTDREKIERWRKGILALLPPPSAPVQE